MMTVRRSKNEMSLMSLNFKNGARSVASRVTSWHSLFRKIIDTLLNGRPSLFRIDSVHQRLLFPTLCWSINTKSVV
jgi:hypothetical protein